MTSGEVALQDKDRMFSASAKVLEDDEICALCLEPFPETIAWPVLQLEARIRRRGGVNDSC